MLHNRKRETNLKVHNMNIIQIVVNIILVQTIFWWFGKPQYKKFVYHKLLLIFNRCQICPYRSKDSSQLTVHLRSHTGDSPFVCPYESCSTSFKTNSDLKRHIRIHTGEKPFKCPYCNYRCAIKCKFQWKSYQVGKRYK